MRISSAVVRDQCKGEGLGKIIVSISFLLISLDGLIFKYCCDKLSQT